MSTLPITCDTLGELDGGAARAVIDAAIREAVSDLEDRGHQDEKPRKVKILLTFDLIDNGLVACRVEAAPVGPARRTASTIGHFRRDGSAMRVDFRRESPDNPNQTTIADFAPEGE